LFQDKYFQYTRQIDHNGWVNGFLAPKSHGD